MAQSIMDRLRTLGDYVTPLKFGYEEISDALELLRLVCVDQQHEIDDLRKQVYRLDRPEESRS